jgi:hypothetical protein
VATCRERHFRYGRAEHRLPARYWVTARPILVQVIEHAPLRRGLWDTLRAGVSLRYDASGVVHQPVADGHGTLTVQRFGVLSGELAGSCVEWLVPGSADPGEWIIRADEPEGSVSVAV